MRGKKGTAQNRAPRKRRPHTAPSPLPRRRMREVTEEELLEALTTSQTLFVAAGKLRVDVGELNDYLETEQISKRLRSARLAAAEQTDTRIVLAGPLMVQQLEDLAQRGEVTDGPRVFAARALLDQAAKVVKQDRTAPGSKKLSWPEPPPQYEPILADGELPADLPPAAAAAVPEGKGNA